MLGMVRENSLTKTKDKQKIHIHTHTPNTFYPNQQYHRQGRGRYFGGNSRSSNYRGYNIHQNTYATQAYTNTDKYKQ